MIKEKVVTLENSNGKIESYYFQYIYDGSMYDIMSNFFQVGKVHPIDEEPYFMEYHCSGKGYRIECNDGYFYGYRPLDDVIVWNPVRYEVMEKSRTKRKK